MTIGDFRSMEGMSEGEFRFEVEEVHKENPLLVRLMIASWEFSQFVEVSVDKNLYYNYILNVLHV